MPEENTPELANEDGLSSTDLFAIVDNIRTCCDHQIPYYAYGDNEAACQMSNLLRQIRDDLIPIAEHFSANDEDHAPLAEGERGQQERGGSHG